jgi:hypothetical protein
MSESLHDARRAFVLAVLFAVAGALAVPSSRRFPSSLRTSG